MQQPCRLPQNAFPLGTEGDIQILTFLCWEARQHTLLLMEECSRVFYPPCSSHKPIHQQFLPGISETSFLETAFTQQFLRDHAVPLSTPTPTPILFNQSSQNSRGSGGRNLAMVCLLPIFLLESCLLGLLIKNTVLLLSTLPCQ